MAIGYLVLALVLATTLNARGRWLRLGGTLLAAMGLFMMVYSIILADLDGTFARIPADASLIERLTPFILNAQAVAASLAILFLLWSAWMQRAARWQTTCRSPTRLPGLAQCRAPFTG